MSGTRSSAGSRSRRRGHAQRIARGFSARLCAAAAVALVAASGAAAEPSGAGRGWEPALSVGFDVQNRGFEADVDSSPSIGASGSGSSTVISSLFRFDGALYAPALFEAAGAPRLVAHAGAQVPLSEGSVIQQSRDTRSVLFTDLETRTNVKFDGNWYAGLGVEFTLPVGGRQFRLRPSVDYFGQSLQFDGQAARVERDAIGTLLQLLSVSASTDEIVHALGPRLTFDIETARVGAFSLNVFLETQFYWIVSERDIRFSGQSIDDTVVPPETHTADFRVKLRPLIAQGGGGLRIVWRGD